jgi:hypothetical protein
MDNISTSFHRFNNCPFITQISFNELKLIKILTKRFFQRLYLFWIVQRPDCPPYFKLSMFQKTKACLRSKISRNSRNCYNWFSFHSILFELYLIINQKI